MFASLDAFPHKCGDIDSFAAASAIVNNPAIAHFDDPVEKPLGELRLMQGAKKRYMTFGSQTAQQHKNLFRKIRIERGYRLIRQ
jgi:hypothetical protein